MFESLDRFGEGLSMIRIIARLPMASASPLDPSWLVIEGDVDHGYLLRAFADLESRQLYDDWVQDLDDAFEGAEKYGIRRDAWRPRSEPLPGPLPFPDLGAWSPDNSEFGERPNG
jgi:hypothetical protein